MIHTRTHNSTPDSAHDKYTYAQYKHTLNNHTKQTPRKQDNARKQLEVNRHKLEIGSHIVYGDRPWILQAGDRYAVFVW